LPYYSTLVRDVSDRKKAEEALKKSEAFTKSIIENEPECVKLLGPGGILKYMNPSGLKMIDVDSLDYVAGKVFFL
jgi:PAS domain-containing protein